MFKDFVYVKCFFLVSSLKRDELLFYSLCFRTSISSLGKSSLMSQSRWVVPAMKPLRGTPEEWALLSLGQETFRKLRAEVSSPVHVA